LNGGVSLESCGAAPRLPFQPQISQTLHQCLCLPVTLYERNIMPLKKGSSEKTISSNIKTLMHEYEDSGTIGTSEPANAKKAHKQAVAIALSKADADSKPKTKSRTKVTAKKLPKT
jgi:hypothetical protein